MRDISSLTPFKHLFVDEDLTPHMVTHESKPTYIQVWERDLGLEFTVTQSAHIYQLTHSCSIEQC